LADAITVRVDHLTPAQIRAYVIADNRLAELAGWDRELLALELQELSVQLNFDVSVTGFETAEVDILIGELGQESPDEVLARHHSSSHTILTCWEACMPTIALVDNDLGLPNA
jgi:hypothetical protein